MIFRIQDRVRTSSGVALASLLLSGVLSAAGGQPVPSRAEQGGERRGPASPAVDLRSHYHEDLTDLSLAGSHLLVRPPIEPEVERLAQFTRSRVSVQWRSGDPFDLYIMRPTGVEKPPVILYLGSFPSESRRFMDEAFCARLTQSGFAAVGFLSALTGDRFQNQPMKKWFISELRESLVRTTHDVQMILNLLTERSEFDMTRVGMFGYGSGATIAILAATADPRIIAIDLVDPWGDWPEWMAKSPVVPEDERASFLKPEFLQDAASLDPLRRLPELKTPHVRLQLIKSDLATPEVAQKKLEAAAPANAVIEHYDNPVLHSSANSGGKLFQWLKDQLRPAEKQTEAPFAHTP